jgi:hypothetical protein
LKRRKLIERLFPDVFYCYCRNLVGGGGRFGCDWQDSCYKNGLKFGLFLSGKPLPIQSHDSTMSADEKQPESGYGQLMACLMRERDRFATESDFQAFALESVRRFIGEVRALDIELMMRPKYLDDRPSSHSAVE